MPVLSRVAIVLPVAGLVLGAAVVSAVVVDRGVGGLPAPSIDLARPERIEVPVDARVAQSEPRLTVPSESWCSTKIPPLRSIYLRGTEIYVAGDTLVLRVPVEGGEAILRETNIGYCMLFGPRPEIQVATIGSWVVFATYTLDATGRLDQPWLFRVRVDGGPIERVARLEKMPIGMSASQTEVIVYYEYARIGESRAFVNPDAIDSELFEIVSPVGGVQVPGLAKIDAPKRRALILSNAIARMTLADGRMKVVGGRGEKLCTIVEAGSPIVVTRFSGWIYYVRDSVLWRVPVDGGRTQRVTKVAFQPDRLGGGSGDFIGWRDDTKPPEISGWNYEGAQEWRVTVHDDSPSDADRAGTSCH